MGPLDFLLHVAGLLAPAAGVALLVSLLGRAGLPKTVDSPSWGVAVTVDFVAGALALLAGLWLFGRDGRMLTYAAVVLACASSQWLVSRGWK